jgi:hypothetical protein
MDEVKAWELYNWFFLVVVRLRFDFDILSDLLHDWQLQRLLGKYLHMFVGL